MKTLLVSVLTIFLFASCASSQKSDKSTDKVYKDRNLELIEAGAFTSW